MVSTEHVCPPNDWTQWLCDFSFIFQVFTAADRSGYIDDVFALARYIHTKVYSRLTRFLCTFPYEYNVTWTPMEVS